MIYCALLASRLAGIQLKNNRARRILSDGMTPVNGKFCLPGMCDPWAVPGFMPNAGRCNMLGKSNPETQ